MEMKYIVYLTINLCNGKIYIGVHRTNINTFDGYIGCGIKRNCDNPCKTKFLKAVNKYGCENFRRITLKSFPDTEIGRKQAYALETILVNNEYLKSLYVYNSCLGGEGGSGESEKRRVYMFDINGNYLRSFDCARSAAIYLDTDDEYSTTKAIRNNCLGTVRSSFGYFWSYEKKFISPENKRLTQIALYDMNGKFIRYWESIMEAQVTLGLTAIWLAISHKSYCGDFQWRYYDGNTDDITPFIKPKLKNHDIPIVMYDKKLNKLGEYDCVVDCIKEHPLLLASQIQRVLKGIIKTHMGYVFKYKDNDIV